MEQKLTCLCFDLNILLALVVSCSAASQSFVSNDPVQVFNTIFIKSCRPLSEMIVHIFAAFTPV